jgi:hypothetical protein
MGSAIWIEFRRRPLKETADDFGKTVRFAGDFERYRKEFLREFELCEKLLNEAIAKGQQFRLLVVS